MPQLHLKGYISRDRDSIISLNDKKPEECKYEWKKYGYPITGYIEEFAKQYGLFGEHYHGLGGQKAIIEDCNLRIYFTDKECSLDEAMQAFDELVFGGDIQTKVSWVGYSEFTITGLELNWFTIGGHDLETEIGSHYGEYMHLIIEV
ncbi:hypothetical protein DXB08_28715 [Hungatella hathewayi]|uniref:hypothetical protein n=1 Tax=Hungatella hathewayi TaxID=154046 RepID=UPI000E42F3F0|nr:hypothetical protein [Hungatella hathewayi]RGO65912.1 hypothetical protein DXB08_28715 [Hungatella hathewayi]